MCQVSEVWLDCFALVFAYFLLPYFFHFKFLSRFNIEHEIGKKKKQIQLHEIPAWHISFVHPLKHMSSIEICIDFAPHGLSEQPSTASMAHWLTLGASHTFPLISLCFHFGRSLYVCG